MLEHAQESVVALSQQDGHTPNEGQTPHDGQIKIDGPAPPPIEQSPLDPYAPHVGHTTHDGNRDLLSTHCLMNSHHMTSSQIVERMPHDCAIANNEYTTTTI